MKVIAILLCFGGIVLALGGCRGQLTSWYTDSNGVVHTHCWSGCKSEITNGQGMSIPDSPIVEDALAIHAAEISTNGDEANISVFRLVDRVSNERGRSGEVLLRQKLPSLAATIANAMPIVRDRLLALNLRTTAGQDCRVAILRELALTESLYRSVSDELTTNRAPASIIRHVVSGENTIRRVYMRDMKPCLAGLQPDTRAAVKYILGDG